MSTKGAMRRNTLVLSSLSSLTTGMNGVSADVCEAAEVSVVALLPASATASGAAAVGIFQG